VAHSPGYRVPCAAYMHKRAAYLNNNAHTDREREELSMSSKHAFFISSFYVITLLKELHHRVSFAVDVEKG
jgi:hypothetical protein